MMNLLKDFCVRVMIFNRLRQTETKNRAKASFVLVEVLLAAAILGVILAPIINFLVAGVESAWFSSREIKAQLLVREGLEAVRSIRQRNWPELQNGTFYIRPEDGNWKLVASDQGEDIDNYRRIIQISSGLRDFSGNLAAESGTPDQATKKIMVTVFWRSLRDRVLSITSYLTRYLDNLVWTQTTQTEFDQGVKEYVETTNVAGGEVQLEGGCGANPSGAYIYDDAFQNTWQIHPSGKNNIREITQPPGQVYQGQKSLELYTFNGADTKLRNQNNICTLGFTRLEFYAYNSAAIPQSFFITGNQWNALKWTEVALSPRVWTRVSIPYADVSQGDEVNLDFIFFKPGVWRSGTSFYLDNITLVGGWGGYYAKGTLTSSVFNAPRQTTFNRISFNANLPTVQTKIGFQVATSNDSNGPWLFYGPAGTSSESDLYTDQSGQGIWLGNNYGQYCRYKAFLFSNDGKNTPVLYDVSINYAP